MVITPLDKDKTTPLLKELLANLKEANFNAQSIFGLIFARLCSLLSITLFSDGKN